MLKESEFKPPWWLSNRHLQTFWSPLAPKTPIPNLLRKRLELADGDFLDLDWVNRDKTSPTLVLLHGLEGNLDSPYLRRMLNQLEAKGWRGLLVYWRGCSGEPNRTDKTYHAGRSEDLEAVMQHLAANDIEQPIFVAGYSLGANILLKWLGEKGRDGLDAPIRAGFAVSTPFDLSICADSIDKGFSKIYKHYLLSTLKKKIIAKYSAERLLKLLNLTAKDILLISSMREFDDRISSKLNGFLDANDYYVQSSSKQYLKYIQVPTVVMHAADDPFMSPEIIPKESELTSSLELRISENGGHVGFVRDIDKSGNSFYLETSILDYFSSFVDAKEKSA
ncbi:hydrolase [Kangiella sp. TOML190]|uniref:hydrolase n=1 Tax=Kangiella sp. TOML190 TaxID=2931351 RepID=UPI002041E308|nr:hydrolase [Kangiella sp. TOML190]